MYPNFYLSQFVLFSVYVSNSWFGSLESHLIKFEAL
jgi:hypothetical protein